MTAPPTSDAPERLILRSWASAGYALIFTVAALIALGYVDPSLKLGFFETLLPGFYLHASNLTLSCCLVLVYGLVRIVMGAKLWEIAAFTLAVVAANYVYELFLPLWNYVDIVDAHHGAVGAVLTFLFMAAVHRWGLRRG